MKPYKSIASRDRFSGHWWIKHESVGLSLEMYKAGPWCWDLHAVYDQMTDESKPLVDYTQLDPKINVVNSVFHGQLIPTFVTIRAAMKWVENVWYKRPMEIIK